MQAEQLKEQALQFLQQEGFPIKESITISVDETLPFMGYTTEKNGMPHIVIAKWALGSEMALGLVIHELGHVYHTQHHHPSHNSVLHSEIIAAVFPFRLAVYQKEIIRNAINNLQDLYADDISFAVYKKHVHLENMQEFFLGWIHELLPPVSVSNTWKNAGELLNACFAKANLERHAIPDKGGKVERAIKNFLRDAPDPLQKAYPFFKKQMVELPEHISDTEFTVLLTMYLNEFKKLTS